MDYSKASKKQLYVIATDDKDQLNDRYAAAFELQERRKRNAKIYRNRPQYKNRICRS